MFFRLLFESFRRQRRRKLLAGVGVLLGTTAVAAMLSLATTIGDRIHRELAVYGANIVVTPQAAALDVDLGGERLHPPSDGASLHGSDLAKLQGIFWANNLIGVSPELSFQLHGHRPDGASASIPALGVWFDHALGTLPAVRHTGVVALHPWWKLSGAWPVEPPTSSGSNANVDHQLVLGEALARRLNLRVGDILTTMQGAQAQPSMQLRVTGIVSTGDATSEKALVPLALAQQIAGQPDAVSRIEITAKTRPEDAFARKDPETLSPRQHDIWYCRPYANSIAFQIREAIPGANAEQVRQVEQSEGTILARISGLLWLISAAALIASGFAVSAAMATAILERQGEIALMRSLGASRTRIAALFYVESAALALAAGTLGFLGGSGLAAWLGKRIFLDAPSTSGTHLGWVNPVLLPIVLALAVAVALLGSTPSIRRALKAEPSLILRELA